MIDLSRLPPPTFIEAQSFDEIFERQIERIVAAMDQKGIDYRPDPSDPVYTLAELYAFDMMYIAQRFNDRLKRTLIAFAEGNDVDNVTAPHGAFREPGESDDELKQRAINLADSIAATGTLASYENELANLRKIYPELVDLRAFSPSPGVSEIVFYTPDEARIPILEREIRLYFENPELKGITDRVVVSPANVKRASIELIVFTGEGADRSLVADEARRSLERYLAASRKIGVSLLVNKIYSAVDVENVDDIDFLSLGDGNPLGEDVQADERTIVIASVSGLTPTPRSERFSS